jgi:endonuclease/exonuclease/phosphatase family metal-dependent hydrolase
MNLMSESHHRDVRIATLNVWGRHDPWPARRSILIEGFRELQPDVVGLQEAITLDGYEQIADLLGPNYNLVHQTKGLIGDGNGNGIGIASRWPVGEVREVNLHLTPRTADFPCATLIAEIFAPDPVGPFLFVNHFPNWQLNFEYEREIQTVAAARVVEELAEARRCHVVLAGDLDADPNAATIRFWTGRQSLDRVSVCYRDAWESAHPNELGHTFTPEAPYVRGAAPDWPFRRIDYIFVRCDRSGPTLNIAACSRIFDEPRNGVWGSDHFGLVADLTVRGSRA